MKKAWKKRKAAKKAGEKAEPPQARVTRRLKKPAGEGERLAAIAPAPQPAMPVSEPSAFEKAVMNVQDERRRLQRLKDRRAQLAARVKEDDDDISRVDVEIRIAESAVFNANRKLLHGTED